MVQREHLQRHALGARPADGTSLDPAGRRPEVAVTEARTASNEIDLGLRHVPSGLVLKAQIVIEAAKPEFTFSLIGKGPLPGPVRYPYPFATSRQTGWWCR